jgi:hypothetical protein
MLRYEPITSRIVVTSYVRLNYLDDVVPRDVFVTIIVTSIYHTVKNAMTEIDLLRSN